MCEKKDSCLTNKKNNGYHEAGECRPNDVDLKHGPSTCRQCCKGLFSYKIRSFKGRTPFNEIGFPVIRPIVSKKFLIYCYGF